MLNFAQDIRWRLELKHFYALAIPVTLQLLFMSARNITDIILTAHLGEVAVASVGVASKLIMIAMVALSGLASACSVLGAQYYGQHDFTGLRRSLGVGLLLSVVFIAVPLGLAFIGLSPQLIQLASTDPAVIETAGEYLRISAAIFVFAAISSVLGIGLRLNGKALIATIFSLVGVLLNVILCFALIHGWAGLTPLGVQGAAWATLLSTLFEAVVICGYVVVRAPEILPRFAELRSMPLDFIQRYLRVAIPATLNGVIWSLGIFTYSAIYGRIGTHELAIMASLTPLEALSIAFEQGFATATSILLGQQLGQKNFEKANQLSRIYLIISISTSIVLGLLLLLSMPLLLHVFHLDGVEHDIASQVYFIMVLSFWIKTINAVGIGGVLRSGGDVGAGLKIDVIGQWFFGIPLALLGAFYFSWSLTIIFALVMLEDVIKAAMTTHRIKSRKWLQTIV